MMAHNNNMQSATIEKIYKRTKINGLSRMSSHAYDTHCAITVQLLHNHCTITVQLKKPAKDPHSVYSTRIHQPLQTPHIHTNLPICFLIEQVEACTLCTLELTRDHRGDDIGASRQGGARGRCSRQGAVRQELAADVVDDAHVGVVHLGKDVGNTSRAEILCG